MFSLSLDSGDEFVVLSPGFVDVFINDNECELLEETVKPYSTGLATCPGAQIIKKGTLSACVRGYKVPGAHVLLMT